ncbi:MAG: thioredoxin [Hyphomicrobiales bacterium]
MTILAVCDATFKQAVLKADKPVVVDFWAEWCGPCKLIAALLEELAGEMDDRVAIVKLDVAQNPAIASHYGVRSIPTLAIFVDGKLTSTRVGAVPRAQLKSWIKAAM